MRLWRQAVRQLSLVTAIALALPMFAQGMDSQISALAERLSRTLAAKGKKLVAVSDFTDLEGRPTEFGRYLAEQLSVDLVNSPGIAVMDRANLKSILAEHKLSEEGLVNPATAKKLGQFSGVDVIILGTVTTLDDGYVVTVKGVATDTAEIVAAASVRLPRTRETQQLAQHSVGAAGESNVSDSTQAPAIATKDFGDLRIALEGVQRAQIRRYGWQMVDAVEVDLNLTNTNVNQAILCAGNGPANNPNSVRAELTNANGTVLEPSEVRGLSSVCVYGYGASPSAIGQTVMYGTHLRRERPYYPRERLWEGNFTSIPPGQTLNVAIIFTSDPGTPRRAINIDNLRLDFEFVVGSGTRRTMDGDLPARARLYTLSLAGLTVQSPRASASNAN